MAMTKQKLIFLASDGTGSIQDAARNLGITVKAMSNWKVDAHGRVKSRAVLDRVIAAVVRNQQERRDADREMLPMHGKDVRELLSLEGLGDE